MSDQNKNILRVSDLVLGVKDDEGEGFRFLIEYGSFEINEGDFVLIKGRNGSGKSTFLRLFHLQGMRYFRFVRGSICFCHQDFPNKSIKDYTSEELTHLNCAVSYIGQEERFLSSDSAYSYIYNTCKIALDYDKSMTPAEKKERLCLVDGIIYDYYEKYLSSSFLCKSYKVFKSKSVRSWSGGQQKMISVLAGIIKARVCSLKLVVMDEPLNNLDGRNKDILNKLITDLRRERVSIIAITHCQVFDGVNKVMSIEECEDGVHRATLFARNEPAHTECLEPFN
ncbi:MAG: ATP-binding cassette domain-containing protein [Clostridia bacterium]|nr:ATP-binding cassette domain-containing protein [Clostridia bacterium]